MFGQEVSIVVLAFGNKPFFPPCRKPDGHFSQLAQVRQAVTSESQSEIVIFVSTFKIIISIFSLAQE